MVRPAADVIATVRAEFCLPIRKFYEQRVTDVPRQSWKRFSWRSIRNTRRDHRPPAHTGVPAFLPGASPRRVHRQHGRRTHLRNTNGALRHQPFHHKPYIGIVDKTSTIHHILDENHLDRDETMFVGDMEHDIEAGQAGGIHTCAVLTGYNALEKLRAMGPT